MTLLATLVVIMSTPPRPPDPSDPQATSQGGSAWGQQTPPWGQGGSAWGQTSGSWNQPGGQPTSPQQPATAPRHAPGYSPADEQPAQTTRQQPSISIQQFAPRRNRLAPLVLAIVAVIAFVAIWWLAIRPNPEASPEASATPTATRTMPSMPPSGEYANSTPFSSNGLAGTFTINDSWWDGSTLSVDITLQVDTGVLKYRFLVMDMASGDIQVMSSAPGLDGLSEATLSAGQSISGVVQVDKDRGDSQIVLSQTTGNNLTMLAVKG